jgi:hypothetical protein
VIDGSAPAVTTAEPELLARWRDAQVFVVVGVTWTTVGGLAAAVTRPLGWELGSWTAAFLVLVGGMAQVGLGVGQAWMGEVHPPARLRTTELVAWNAGVVLTVAGTFAGQPPVTSLGGVALAVALGSFLVATRERSARARGWQVAYRALVAVVLISIPIGLALSWLRHR